MNGIELRVSDEIYEEIVQAAAKYNLSVPTWCTVLIIGKLAEMRVEAKKEGK